MNSNQHWTESEDRLENFVLDRIDPGERSDLEQHLLSCEPCRRRLAQEYGIASGIRQHARAKMKLYLKSAIDPEKDDIPWPRIVSIAALLIIIAGIGYFNKWFFEQKTTRPETERIVADGPRKTVTPDSTPREGAPGDDKANGPPKEAHESEKNDRRAGSKEYAKKQPHIPGTEQSVASRINAAGTSVWLTGEIDLEKGKQEFEKTPSSQQSTEGLRDSDSPISPGQATESTEYPRVFRISGGEIGLFIEIDSSLNEKEQPFVRALMREDSAGRSLTIHLPPSLAGTKPLDVTETGGDSLIVTLEGMVIRFRLPRSDPR